MAFYFLLNFFQFNDKYKSISIFVPWSEKVQFGNKLLLYLHYLYQHYESIVPPISRIGLIRTINIIRDFRVALERYDYVQCNHSYCNIFRAIGKSLLVKKLLDDLKQTNVIRTRLGYGGAHAKIECIQFQLFKSIWENWHFSFWIVISLLQNNRMEWTNINCIYIIWKQYYFKVFELVRFKKLCKEKDN